MGAAHGASGIPPRFIEGLHESKAIGSEIEAFVSALFPEAAGAGQATAEAGAGAAGEL